MTREELLKGLHWVKNWKCNGDGDVHEIISEAIEALEAQAERTKNARKRMRAIVSADGRRLMR